jgi:hypothetical protein
VGILAVAVRGGYRVDGLAGRLAHAVEGPDLLGRRLRGNGVGRRSERERHPVGRERVVGGRRFEVGRGNRVVRVGAGQQPERLGGTASNAGVLVGEASTEGVGRVLRIFEADDGVFGIVPIEGREEAVGERRGCRVVYGRCLVRG